MIFFCSEIKLYVNILFDKLIVIYPYVEKNLNKTDQR